MSSLSHVIHSFYKKNKKIKINYVLSIFLDFKHQKSDWKIKFGFVLTKLLFFSLFLLKNN